MKRYETYRAVQPLWNMEFPTHWEVFPLCSMAKEKSICNCTELELLSVYLDAGVVPFSKRTEKRTQQVRIFPSTSESIQAILY